MMPKGLLVVAPQGQEFLLVPEVKSRTAHYTLSVLQHSSGQWVRLQPRSANLLRESMLGALLEFFGNLCRILNQAPIKQIGQPKTLAPKKTRRTATHSRDNGAPKLRRRGRNHNKTATPASTISRSE